MVISVRLELAHIGNGNIAAKTLREAATSMGITINRIKVRDDVVHLYGTKEVIATEGTSVGDGFSIKQLY